MLKHPDSQRAKPQARNGRRPRTSKRLIRFAAFLAPNLFPLYAFITRYVGEKLGRPTELFVGATYEQGLQQADAAFICGLAYVHLARGGMFEPIAAPVLHGHRYGDQPIYFSDVLVRRDSSYRSFADLRGCRWGYNEPYSQSGYGATRYRLAQLGETNGYFGKVIQAGYHQRVIGMLSSGEIDSAAIDSHVLAVEIRRRPELAQQLRVIDILGPSTVQPIVAGRWLPQSLKDDLQTALLEMNQDWVAERCLADHFVKRFTRVSDASYDDIRAMRIAAEAAKL